MKINEKVMLLRKANSKTLKEFADETNISVDRLEMIESGHEVPNVKEMWAMINKYNVNMKYFMEGII